MVNSKNLTIVTISTILFGLLSKWLVGVPYMAWGYFDKLFIASFILWMLYSTMLYLAIKIENENYLKLGFTGVVFGLISACLKMGLDAIIEHFTKFSGNLIVTAFMMEMGILIFGSAIIFVLYVCVAKKKILWNKSMKNCTLGLGGIAGIYFAVIIYYLWQLRHWMEKFADFDIIRDWRRTRTAKFVNKICSGINCGGNDCICPLFYSFMDRFKKEYRKQRV